jgi:hypothetical protein
MQKYTDTYNNKSYRSLEAVARDFGLGGDNIPCPKPLNMRKVRLISWFLLKNLIINPFSEIVSRLKTNCSSKLFRYMNFMILFVGRRLICINTDGGLYHYPR